MKNNHFFKEKKREKEALFYVFCISFMSTHRRQLASHICFCIQLVPIPHIFWKLTTHV